MALAGVPGSPESARRGRSGAPPVRGGRERCASGLCAGPSLGDGPLARPAGDRLPPRTGGRCLLLCGFPVLGRDVASSSSSARVCAGGAQKPFCLSFQSPPLAVGGEGPFFPSVALSPRSLCLITLAGALSEAETGGSLVETQPYHFVLFCFSKFQTLVCFLLSIHLWNLSWQELSHPDKKG